MSLEVASTLVPPDYEALIVGTGFGGMGVAIELGRMGITSILMLDRADDLGGTWHLNHYPGLAVDIASVTYSYSFEPNPNWSRVFAPGSELKSYAHHVAEKYQLRRYMRFNSSVEQVVYDEARKIWNVSFKDEAGGAHTVTTRILVLATGYLSRPQKPKIAGIDRFAGKVIHTAAWDDDYDLQGKRAAVIGTGATAVQLLPEIAPKLAHLDVYQRTAIWVAPKNDAKISPGVRKLFANLPITQRILRWFHVWLLEFMSVAALFHHKRLPFLTYVAERVCRANIARYVKDAELRRKLTPQYRFGCKRPTFSNHYYRVFTRDNVELVTDSIDYIESDGIVTQDGTKRPIDTLVLATGFSVWERDEFHSIVGKNGVELRDQWEKDRYQSYEGITVPGFPNLFYLPSPYSYTGLSYFFTVESQMKHIARCLGEMKRRNATSFEVDGAAQSGFVEQMSEKFKGTIFIADKCVGARSYYFDKHGDPSLIRPTSVRSAQHRHETFPLSDYHFE